MRGRLARWWVCLAAWAIGPDAAQAQALDPAIDGPSLPPAPSPWGARGERVVDLVFTGATGGVGLGRYTFEVGERLRDAVAEHGVEVLGVQPLHAVLAQGDHRVWAEDGAVASTFSFAWDGGPTCGDGAPVSLWVTPHEAVVLAGDGLRDLEVDLAGAVRHERVLRRCSAGGAVAWWLAPAGALPPEWDLDAWDVRLGYALQARGPDGPRTIPVFGRPRQEATRRFRLLSDVLQAEPDALFVDAGDFLDGVSTARPGSLSIHRGTGLEMLSRLGPTALVPGAQDLAPGVGRLVSEARSRGLPYVVTNEVRGEGEPRFPRVLRRTVHAAGGEVDLAFLGAVDPRVVRDAPALKAEGFALADPSEAVQAAIDGLLREPDPPDVIVLLTRMGGEALDRVRARVHGLDLVVGDTGVASPRVAHQAVDVRRIPSFEQAAPLTLPLDGVAVARLRIGEDGLVGVRTVPLPVRPDMPPDPEVTRRVTRVRAVAYPGRDAVMVPSDPADPLGRMSDARFGHLACEALREIAGSEVGLLAALPPGPGVPGPLTGFLASQRLGVLDVVEVHAVDGAKLKELLDRSESEVATRCGASGSTVAGRSIDASRTYRVATTDRTRVSTRVGELLEAARVRPLRKDHPGWVTLSAPGSEAPLSLHAAVLTVLEREAASEQGVGSLMARTPSTRTPRWSLDVSKLALDVSRFDGTGREELASVPDAQANGPSNLTVGTDVDAALRYDSVGATWELRTKLAYRAITVDDGEPTESLDDIQLSTASSLPLARFPRQGSFRLQPFGEVLWDSEFTPREAEGEVLPRQSDLFVTLGLSSGWKWIKSLRLGAFLNQDLARVRGKPPEFGGRLDLETSLTLPPASTLRFDTSWDLRVWADTPADDASDLRVRLLGELRLLGQPVRWFQVGVFVQGYVAQGRAVDNAVVGASWTAGATLQLSHAFDLTRPVRRRVPRRWRGTTAPGDG